MDIYDNETFMASASKFYVVCTDVETGKPVYRQLTDMYKEIDYLRASASLPYFSRLVEIDEKKYLDGSCSESVPIETFRKMGYEKNVIILTRQAGYEKKPEKHIPSTLFIENIRSFQRC